MVYLRDFVVVALMLISGTICAQSGALEINQLCVATGCFDGDAPGLPVTLNQPGQLYVLTSDLQVPAGQGRGVTIQADQITFDLNGFGILGPVTCSSGSPPVCTPTASTTSMVVSEQAAVTIRNGTISGAQSSCIDIFLGQGSVLENLRINNCLTNGIQDDGNNVLRNLQITNVGVAGYRAVSGNGSFIQDTYISIVGQGVINAICDNVVILNEVFASSCRAPGTRGTESAPSRSIQSDRP